MSRSLSTGERMNQRRFKILLVSFLGLLLLTQFNSCSSVDFQPSDSTSSALKTTSVPPGTPSPTPSPSPSPSPNPSPSPSPSPTPGPSPTPTPTPTSTPPPISTIIQ